MTTDTRLEAASRSSHRIVPYDRARHGDGPWHVVKTVFDEYGFEFEVGDYDADVATPHLYYDGARGWFWAAEDPAGRVVGCIGLTDEGEGIFELHRLYVLPEARRTGLGRALVDLVIREATASSSSATSTSAMPTASTSAWASAASASATPPTPGRAASGASTSRSPHNEHGWPGHPWVLCPAPCAPGARPGGSVVPRPRCLWCMEPPLEEVAVLKWRGEERERLTIPLCRKHLARLREAGEKGREQKGWSYKVGWW